MIILTIFLFGLIMSALGTKVLIRVLRQRAVLDLPNERSSHSIPTPRGGGIAIMIAIGLGWSVIVLTEGLDSGSAARPEIIAITLSLAIFCFLDDIRGLGAGVRILVQTFCALFALMQLPEHALVFQGLVPFWLDRLIALLGFVWFINLYNFMDGIDGISGIETIFLGFGVVLMAHGLNFTFDQFMSRTDALTGTVIAGAALGFLFFNWHPAKIFMGDVGSVSLGFLLGWFLLHFAAHGAWVPALLIPAYYLCDATLTLLMRLFRGEKVWQAHRSHFYQKAALSWGTHRRPVAIVIVLNACLLLLAVRSLFFSDQDIINQVIHLVIGLVLVAIVLFAFHRTSQRMS